MSRKGARRTAYERVVESLRGSLEPTLAGPAERLGIGRPSGVTLP